jgi:UDP-glucose 4-epimerase
VMLGLGGLVSTVHKPGRATDVPVNVLDASLIRREMGWAPRTEWTDALRATAGWLRGRGAR